jgi:hypothetical protein
MRTTTQEKPIAKVKGEPPMNVMMVRSKVKADRVAEVEAAIKQVAGSGPS